ncbi:hypothetical protein EVAR_28175_1 [Eumeta japonica]|uniref:Uncharacterized protein n=1 Tax=Eumeta variegata TaxID=151549 RepID=A0A4C1VIH3_EUMVA|nr:hypothetical protein EVAR_28175_1 [Eumeta japonica]
MYVIELSVRAIPLPISLQHKNEPALPVKNHTLTEYAREVAACVITFRSVNECGGPLPYFTFHQPYHLSITYPVPSQGTGNALVGASAVANVHGRR